MLRAPDGRAESERIALIALIARHRRHREENRYH
jgi:hypothetical protein